MTSGPDPVAPCLDGQGRMTTRAELWAAVDRRKAEHAAGLPFTAPAWNDFDAAVRAAERTHLMDPDTADRRERIAFCEGLHALAVFLVFNPDAPLPPGDMVRHLSDAAEFDKAVAVIGGEDQPCGPFAAGYERVERKFGPIRYGVQTDGRKAQQVKRREEAIAKRERELGLSTEDIGQAA